MPEVIDLLSSDSFKDILFTSPPRLTDASTRRDSFNLLSDDVEPSQDNYRRTGIAKRRRLTPPRKAAASVVSAAPIVPQAGSKSPSFDDVDAIVVSSPPQQYRRPQSNGSSTVVPKSKAEDPFNIFDEFDEIDETPQKPVTTHYSSKTAALLANLDSKRGAAKTMVKVTAAKPTKTTSKTKKPLPPVSSIDDPSSQMAPPLAKRRTRLTTPEKERRVKDKAQEKEAAATARALLKAEKQREKQLAADLAEVNKARHDKKISVGEMVLRIPEKLFEKNIGRLTEDVAKQLGVDVQMIPSNDSRLPNEVLTWKRKVRARFDDEQGHWVPLDKMEMRDEKSHVLCMIEANSFVKMVQQDAATASEVASSVIETSDDPRVSLDAHINLLRRRWPHARPIYLVEGLETFMRKSKNAKNRNYQAAVRAQEAAEAAPAGSQSKRKRKQHDTVLVDDDMIEDAMLRLQVEHNCLIHHTATAPETAEWIGNFTQHISTIPYKLQQSTAEASFCMDVGQVRTGEDKDDTYVKMLQEIMRVTLPVAYGVAAKYPTVISLVQAMRQQGPLLLEDLKKCSNKNGSFTDARIGPALSKRIHKVFMGTDQDSMDV